MGTLYLTQIQPNPPGRDTVSPGKATAAQLNIEWVQVTLIGTDGRSLQGDRLDHSTYSSTGCMLLGNEKVIEFASGTLLPGQSMRVHTGPGESWWEGNLVHTYAGRNWFLWNNRCGDKAVFSFGQSVIDWAAYTPNPREGVLVRQQGTNRFV